MSDIYEAPKSELSNTSITTDQFGTIEKGIQGDYKLAVGDVLREAWSLTNGAKKKIHLGMLLYLVVYMGISIAAQILFSIIGIAGVGLAMTSADPSLSTAGAVGIFVTSMIVGLLIAAISTPLTAGLMMMGVRRSVGAPLPATTVLAYWGRLLPLAIAMIVMSIIIYLGFLILILPGLFLSVATCMTMLLIVDKNLGAWAGIMTSIKAVSKRWFTVAGIIFSVLLINVIPMLPFIAAVVNQSVVLGLVGLVAMFAYIWILPFTIIAMGVSYRNMFGYESDPAV